MKKTTLAVCLLLPFSALPLHAQWTATSASFPGDVTALAVSGTTVIAGTDSGGVFISTNAGATWAQSTEGLPHSAITSFVTKSNGTDGSLLFAGTWGSGVVLSTNSGSGWIVVSNGLTNFNVHSLVVSGSSIFAATQGGVFLSTNDGTTWSAASTGLPNTDCNKLALCGTSLLVGTSLDGVYRSTDGGANWNQAGTELATCTVTTLAATSDTNVFAAVNHGEVYRSTDGGSSWTNANWPQYWIWSMYVVAARLFVGSSASTEVLTWDGPDAGWRLANTGMSPSLVECLADDGTYLYAGVLTGKIWRRPLAELSTSVNPQVGAPSGRFDLFQNYPNPFNPATVINGQWTEDSWVKLEVYDVLGRKVATLANGRYAAGRHSFTFDAHNLSSGVYFYQLQAGTSVATKRMLLMR